jgi:hypothetical protein
MARWGDLRPTFVPADVLVAVVLLCAAFGNVINAMDATTRTPITIGSRR